MIRCIILLVNNFIYLFSLLLSSYESTKIVYFLKYINYKIVHKHIYELVHEFARELLNELLNELVHELSSRIPYCSSSARLTNRA